MTLDNPIPPILLKAFPEGTRASFGAEPTESYINGGLGAKGATRFITSYGDENTRSWRFSFAGSITGFCMASVAGVVLVLNALFAHRDGLQHHPEDPWSVTATVAGYIGVMLLLVGLVVFTLIGSPLRPAARKWTASLQDAWDSTGYLLTPVNTLPDDCREDLLRLLRELDRIRRGLAKGGLQPDGSELDNARWAVVEFLKVADLPKDGDLMAAATHIKDPLVRQAGREYKAALKARNKAYKRIVTQLRAADNLLESRRRNRDDSRLIAVANASRTIPHKEAL